MPGELDELLKLRADPYARARRWKEESGGMVLGFFCCYAPEEMIHAAGALPVRVTGENRTIGASAAHLQSYCCSLARTGLDMALEGDLDFLDGTVFVHTCDTMQRLSDIWRLGTGFTFHSDVVLPVRFEGESSRDYMRRELEGFRVNLEEFLGEITDEDLSGSIEAYNLNRRLLSELYDLRRADPALMPSDQAIWTVASSALVPKEEHNEILENLLGELRGRAKGTAAEEKVRLFGVGSVMDQWEFLRMLEEVGGTLVDDDFCTGHRYFEVEASGQGDPVEAIAARMWDKPYCPCKHRPSSSRADCLMEKIEGSGAQGVIFFQFKFCEPHAFDYPYLKKAIDEKGIPTLEVEVEQGSVSIPALRTRVEAMLETIRGV